MEMASETTQNSALRTDEAASHGPLWRLIDYAVTAHANRAKVPVNRKAYLRWCLLGVFGAQRFYTGGQRFAHGFDLCRRDHQRVE